jgi:hypothetical protein
VGSNNSIVALRVLGGEKKGTQCLELGHPVPGGHEYGDLALLVGGIESETVKDGHESCGT